MDFVIELEKFRIKTANDIEKRVVFDDVYAKTIKFDRCNGGIATLGGNGNGNGELHIKDENDVEKMTIDKDGIASTNFNVDADGNMECSSATLTGDIFLPDGGKVIGGDGILGNLQYEFRNYSWMFPDGSDTKNGYYFLGYNTDFFEAPVWKNYIMADIDIPENFTVTEAKIKLLHANVRWDNGSAQAWGYCRNLRAYKVTNANNFSVYAAYASEFDGRLIWSKSEISNAFGSSGFTAPVATNFGLVETESTDISSSLNTGNNKIIIQTANNPGAFTTNPDTAITRFGPHTGYVYALINIKGYMKI